jgi:hypothetical protein
MPPPSLISTVAGRAQININSVPGSGAPSDVEQRAPSTLEHGRSNGRGQYGSSKGEERERERAGGEGN